MPRHRLLVGLDAPPAPRSPQAGRLRALARGCDLVLCAAGPSRSGDGSEWARPSTEAFWLSLARAAASSGARAAVLLDGPAVRAALRSGRFDAATRVALWADAATQSAGASLALPRPAAYIRRQDGSCPDELWWTGPRGASDPSEFLPGTYRRVDEAAAGTLAARFAAGTAPAPAPKRGLTTIVIPCWNGWADTRRCLGSVIRNTQVPFEVVVVDNGSTDGTARRVRALGDPRVQVVSHEENLGFARAVNRGLLEARGPYAVWLNNDCVVTPGWLELMQDALERAPWIGAVGPMSHGCIDLQRVRGRAPAPRELPRFAALWSMNRRGRMSWTHRLVGYCLLHRTELLKRIGYLDERFGLGCYEDFDWCLRARQAGCELYVAEDVVVGHRGQATFDAAGLPRKQILLDNRKAFVEKWCRRGLEFLDAIDDRLSIPREAPRRR